MQAEAVDDRTGNFTVPANQATCYQTWCSLNTSHTIVDHRADSGHRFIVNYLLYVPAGTPPGCYSSTVTFVAQQT